MTKFSNPETIIEFEAPVGSRIHRNFHGVRVEGDPSLWWSVSEGRWKEYDRDNPGHLSNYAPCRTLKAFKRHLRKHAASLRGRRVVLSSRWMGHDAWAEVL